MSEHPDFKTEPVPGLPEELPTGESILWQGRPVAWRLAFDALWLKWVLVYFAVLILWRIGASASVMPLGAALGTAVPLLVLALVVSAVLYGVAMWQAKSTLYTITTARVVMRIGAAVSMTLNLPLTKVKAASVAIGRGGSGTITLEMDSPERLSLFMLWPHNRPWHINRPQPALRCVADAQSVAAHLGDAAEIMMSHPKIVAAPVAEGVPA